MEMNIKNKIIDTKKVSQHKPSVDKFIWSVNNTVGSAAMAVMMTVWEMMVQLQWKNLYDNGAYTVISKMKKLNVVFGMPMKAIQAGTVKDIVHLDEIADYIIEFFKRKKR